jgi:hypothetical protein
MVFAGLAVEPAFAFPATNFREDLAEESLAREWKQRALALFPCPNTPQPIILWPNFRLNSSKKPT